MDNKVLSIEVGDFTTKICVMNYRKKHPKIYQMLTLDTPQGCVEDGLIQDKFALAEAVKNKMRGRYANVTDVVFTISSTRIAVHEVVIPMVKQKDIRDYVDAGVADYFPINISDYAISYMILERLNQEKKYRILVIAVNNFLLTTYSELAKLLKLNIISIDYLGNSILQMIKTQISHKETSMFVQINEKNSLVNIMDNGVLRLTRTIGYGIEDSLENITSNINRVLEYYASKNTEGTVQTMYLSGVGARADEITELLHHEFGLQIKYIEGLNGINIKQAFISKSTVVSDYMNCIGASLAPLGIFPKQYLKKEEIKSSRKELLEIGALVAVASIALIITSQAKLSNAENERTRLNKEIAGLKQVETIYEENNKLSDKMSLLSTIDKNCYRNTEQLGELLDEIEAKLPKSTIIQSFQANETELIMDVSIDSMESAAMTFVQLDTMKLITDVKTEQITVSSDEFGVMKLNYIITANYAPSEKEDQADGADS